MKVRILSSGPFSGNAQFLTSFLINDVVAIDGGAVGLHGGLVEQDRIRHVFLTHSHADHIATLPILIENNCRREGDSVTVLGHRERWKPSATTSSTAASGRT